MFPLNFYEIILLMERVRVVRILLKIFLFTQYGVNNVICYDSLSMWLYCALQLLTNSFSTN